MKLEAPLASVIDHCMRMCVAECCGVDAYDFSPIHIASYLISYGGAADATEVQKIRDQLGALKANHGSKGTAGVGVSLEKMNQGFTGVEVDRLVDTLHTNLDIALVLIDQVESGRVGAVDQSTGD